MATITLLGAVTFDTNSGTKTVTATPAVGDLIIIIAAKTGNVAGTFPTDNNQSGTYTNVSNVFKATNADFLSLFIRESLIKSAVSTIFSSPQGTTTGGGLAVLKVTGMAKFGLAAVRSIATVYQVGIQSNQAAAGTPAPVYPAVPLTDNPQVGVVFNATSPATMTPRASWTERVDVGYATPTTGLEIMTVDSGQTAQTVTWGGTSASAFCSLAFELDASVNPLRQRFVGQAVNRASTF